MNSVCIFKFFLFVDFTFKHDCKKLNFSNYIHLF